MEYEVLLYFGWPAFKGLVTEDQIIEKAIEEFLGTFDTIYSVHESFMWKINLHYLKHLPVMVQTYGPLPVQSAYSTENTMGHLAERVMTGTNVSHQFLNKNHDLTNYRKKKTAYFLQHHVNTTPSTESCRYNETKAKQTTNHCIRTINQKYYI
ncbi:hypothetical protein BLOT_001581, partial [Blomia tropicalis]